MNIKSMLGEKRQKRPQTMCLRRKSIKVKPVDLYKDDDSPLLARVGVHQETIQEKPAQEKVLVQKIPKQSNDHQHEKMNKIYNKTDKYRKIQSLGIPDRVKFSRASVNYLCPNKNDVILQSSDTRPKSSQNKKFMQSSEIFKNNNDVLNYQNRPGSSKSSRVFKRKIAIENDPLNTENQQFDDLIRVTSINGNRLKNGKYTTQNRISTSINPLERSEKVPDKIDPQFYRLFAQ